MKSEWRSIEWTPVDDFYLAGIRCKRVIGTALWLAGKVKNGIGVDPGRNFGIASVNSIGRIDVLWGQMPQQPSGLRWRYGITAIKMMEDVYLDGEGEMPAVVEGAAYNAEFGQVGLAEVRFGFAYGLEQRGCAVAISSPAHIRSVVMGKIDHKEHRGMFGYWPSMNTNAADAVGVAAYAAGYRKEEKSE